jgi:hypothetical protein
VLLSTYVLTSWPAASALGRRLKIGFEGLQLPPGILSSPSAAINVDIMVDNQSIVLSVNTNVDIFFELTHALGRERAEACPVTSESHHATQASP